MAEKTTNGPQPLAAGRGILRQFETEVFRARPDMARSNVFLSSATLKHCCGPTFRAPRSKRRTSNKLLKNPDSK